MPVGDTEKLIESIKRHRILYDPFHEQHKDYRRRDVAWEELGLELQQNVIVTADCGKRQLSLKAVGSNPSGVDGLQLEKDEDIIVKPDSVIELLLNSYRYEIIFDSVSSTPKSSLRKKNLVDSKKLKTSTEDILALEVPSAEDMFKSYDSGLFYVFTKKGVKRSNKIAAYDFDGTLVKTKSGNVFPKNIDDWQLCYPEVPAKLKHYLTQGYKIVLFTNQASIGKKKLKPEDFKKKLDNVLHRIGVPAQVFISTGTGKYRKPATGMWDAMCEMDGGIDINMVDSFYCGDAAGRANDHSFADRLFAENLNLTFQTPEQHFKGQKGETFKRPRFDIKSISRDGYDINKFIRSQQEVIILVGFPGCGKSSFASKIINTVRNKHGIVSQDALKTLPKCFSMAEKILKEKKSVIIDNTNLDVEIRKRWIKVAQDHNLPCRCIWFDIPLEHSEHNNAYRQITNKEHVVISKMLYNTFKKKFVEPTEKEGFSSVQKMKFSPEFSDKKNEALYFQHLLENRQKK